MVFSEKEIERIKKFRAWATALPDGKIVPENPEQKKFVAVNQNVAAPTEEREKLWHKYLRFRRSRKELRREHYESEIYASNQIRERHNRIKNAAS